MTDLFNSEFEITHLYACWTFPGHEAEDGWYLKGDRPSEAIDYMYSHPEQYKLNDDDIIPGDDDMIFRGHVFKVELPDPLYDFFSDRTTSGEQVCFLPDDKDMIVQWEKDKQTATNMLIDFIQKQIGRLCDKMRKEGLPFICYDCKKDFTNDIDERSGWESYEEIGKIICVECWSLRFDV